MKTRLHTADVLTFTLTGAEPQRALTLAALAAAASAAGGRPLDRKAAAVPRAGRIFGAAGLTSRPATGCSLGVFGDTTAQPFCLDDRF